MKIGVTMYETSFPAAHFQMKIPNWGDYPLTDVLLENHVTPVLLSTVFPSQEIISKIFSQVDGLILGGGDDISPTLYHENPLVPSLNYPARDLFEVALVRNAVRLRKPVLGICRGNQLLNVALGGNLYQNIYRQISHSLINHTSGFHQVTIDPGSQLYKVFGRRQRVNSRHHQAIKRLGHGLRVVARADDHIIEGVESNQALIQGVQWHPENLWANSKSEEHLFQTFFRRVARSNPN